MRHRRFEFALACGVLLWVIGWIGCTAAPPPTTTNPKADAAWNIEPAWLEGYQPLPANFETASNRLEDCKVELGHRLFRDKRLSRGGDLSCNSCHDLSRYGVDNQATSPGHKGQRGTRNSPTVFNAAAHFAQFWDGRAATVEEQAKGPVLNPVEMAMGGAADVTKRLRAIPEYEAAFRAAFPDQAAPVNFENAALAIAAFERTLATPARWDRFLQGESSALTPAEKAGFRVFVETGCNACHHGMLVGGTMFQRLGLVKDWPETRDQGRYELTKQDVDRMLFKVPSLRNVTKTGPYYHDGSVPTLDRAIRLMAKHQLGQELSDERVRSIMTWLSSLTGEPPATARLDLAAPPPSRMTPEPGIG